MSRRSSGIGVLATAAVILGIFVVAIGGSLIAHSENVRRTSAFTNAFLAQSSRNTASRISASKAVALSQSSESKAMPMPLILPLFLRDSKFSSVLILVNGGGAITYADVAVRDLNGNQIASERVNFAPHSQQRVDIATMLASAISPVAQGSIVITPSPQATSETIAAQLSMTYFGSSEPNYIDEEVAMPMPDSSQILRAVADSGDGSPFVAITSLSNAIQHVTLSCLGEAREASSKQVPLAPNATFIGPACAAGNSETSLATLDEPGPATDPAHQSAIGIALTSDGAPGSFAAFALQSHRTKEGQFFSSVPFSDPKMLMSPDTIFAGVPVGSADQLPGTGYTPEISLANFHRRIAA